MKTYIPYLKNEQNSNKAMNRHTLNVSKVYAPLVSEYEAYKITTREQLNYKPKVFTSSNKYEALHDTNGLYDLRKSFLFSINSKRVKAPKTFMYKVKKALSKLVKTLKEMLS